MICSMMITFDNIGYTTDPNIDGVGIMMVMPSSENALNSGYPKTMSKDGRVYNEVDKGIGLKYRTDAEWSIYENSVGGIVLVIHNWCT